MSQPDILKLLARSDKWYQGGGGRLLWAPPFPLHLDSPGFWDPAHYYNYEFKPLFTWTCVDDDGREVELVFRSRQWNPALLMQRFAAPSGHLAFAERKCVLPNGIALCSLRIRNTARHRRRLHIVAWTAQETWPARRTTWLSETAYRRGTIEFRRDYGSPDRPDFTVCAVLGISPPPRSYSINLSEGLLPPPRWALTPFSDQFARGRLSNRAYLEGVDKEGILFLGLHTAVTPGPGAQEEITVALATAPSIREARANICVALEAENPVGLSEMNWRDYFASVPRFTCSDDFFSRYYWYRWYGLKLNTIASGEGNYSYPFVCEGIGYFRAPISYSAPCHVRENAWMSTPELAQGSVLTFIENQREDGAYRGYIDVNSYRRSAQGSESAEPFYHANWGRALLHLHALHPSQEFLGAVYPSLKRYAFYFDRERDEEVSGLYDIDNHYETGQEYMHRYVTVEPAADRQHWGEVFRLKGVDVTVYVYEVKRALALIAGALGHADEADLWDLEAEKIKAAILSTMWDPGEEMFFDVDPRTGERTKVKAATCFYPYFTDIVSESHLSGLRRHLLSPREFWTPFPVPSSSADDEFYSPDALWKGKRMNCPWNGRVWPMTNSHVAEAIAVTARRFHNRYLQRKAAQLITRFVRMMFFEGDPARPNCFEHYHPVTGQPSLYRGVDDYQHSWVNDLIIRFLCGIRVEGDAVIVEPFPFGLKQYAIEDVFVQGRRFSVRARGGRLTVFVDGAKRAEGRLGTPVTVPLKAGAS